MRRNQTPENGYLLRSTSISSLVSVNEATPQPAAGQRQRHLRHTRRTARPNAGKSTNRTKTDVFGPHQPAATPTHRPRPCLDMNHQRFGGFVVDADNVDIA